MGIAYDGDDLRAAALERNLLPVVPAHPLRKLPWPLDKLDAIYVTFVSVALICEHFW